MTPATARPGGHLPPPILSTEGVVQGCPFGSHLYGLVQTMKLAQLFGLLDPADPSFPIVTP